MEKITKLKEFLQESPQDSFLQHALALEYIKINQDEAAEKLLRKLLRENPGYVGSYYHIGQLLERKGEEEAAAQWYEHGMEQAKLHKEQHAYNELQSALDELMM